MGTGYMAQLGAMIRDAAQSYGGRYTTPPSMIRSDPYITPVKEQELIKWINNAVMAQGHIYSTPETPQGPSSFVTPQAEQGSTVYKSEAKDFGSAEEYAKNVDKDLVYHGSSYSGDLTSSESQTGEAIFFTNDAFAAEDYGKYMHTAKLNITNPLVYDAEGKKYSSVPQKRIIKEAKEAGHDAVVFKNIIDSKYSSIHTSDVTAVFNNKSINVLDVGDSEADPDGIASGERIYKKLTDEWNKAQKGSAGERCTNATLKALGVSCDKKAMYGTSVLDAIKKSGAEIKHLTPKEIRENNDVFGKKMTLGEFIERHPKGKYYIHTSGHSMALVDGELTDTAKGTNRRRVEGAHEILKK